MWVEARPIAVGVPEIHAGSSARVSPDGVNWIDGTVVQRYHRVDEKTRTHGVRIEVDNPDDTLHERQFVEVEIVTGAGKPALAVPSAAVTMIGETPTVFKSKPVMSFTRNRSSPVQPWATGRWFQPDSRPVTKSRLPASFI